MAPRSVALTAAMLGAAVANPVSFTPVMVPRQAGDTCAPFLGDQPYVASVGFYSDMNCNEGVGGVCLYVQQRVVDEGVGAYDCNPPSLPDAPFFLRTDDSAFDALQLLFTRDQSCPPSGPGAVYATLVDNRSCVQSNLGGADPGVSVFPNGGAGITREQNARSIDAEVTVAKPAEEINTVAKRQSNTKCDGFIVESQQPSQSRTVQVSNIIDCTNGGDQGCTISVEEQESQTITTSYSLTAGGGIEGIFSVEATFGMEFSQEVSTSVQNGFNVNAGQRGYIGAYNGATLFTGRFTGCDSGDAEQPGSTLALKDNQIFYSIILTGASRNGTFEE